MALVPPGVLAASGRRWTPVNDSALIGWEAGVSTYSDTAFTTVAADGDTVGSRRAAFGSANQTQVSAGSRFTYHTGPPRFTTDGSRWLDYSAGIALVGACTLYAVGTRAGGSIWLPFAGTGSNELVIYSDNNVYCGDTVIAYTGATGLILVRFRRTVGNVWKFAATGMAETDVVTSATARTLTLCGRWAQIPANTAAGNDHRGEYVHPSADMVASGSDVQMRAYLASRYPGATIP